MPGEFDLISKYFAPLATDPGAFGLTDDAALLTPEVVVTTDALVAGVHFLASDPPADVAAKALGVNLSDLAGMAAAPLAYTLTIALPKDFEESWVEAFAKGLAESPVPLIGGDTVSTPGPLTLTVTAFGQVEPGRALRRSGAEAGQGIWVTGTIGDAALGLLSATGKLLPELSLIDRYRRPRPRTDLGRRLAGIASAGMDISDGLVADLGHLCRQSGLAAVIEAARVPLSEAAQSVLAEDPTLLEVVLCGGDDYELLLAVPEGKEEDLRRISQETETPVTRIGTLEAGEGVRVLDRGGEVIPLTSGGFTHF